MTAIPANIPNEDRVRQIAHSLWIDEGMPEGRAEHHWFKALQLVAFDANVTVAEAAAKAVTKVRGKAAAAGKTPTSRRSKS